MFGYIQKDYSLKSLTQDELDGLISTLNGCLFRNLWEVSTRCPDSKHIGKVLSKVKQDVPISSGDLDLILACLEERRNALLKAKSALVGFEPDLLPLLDCSKGVLDLKVALVTIRENI